jgi:hypothetical protein
VECYIRRGFITSMHHHILLADEIKEDEMNSACSMHGKDGKCIQYFGWKTQREETTWKM